MTNHAYIAELSAVKGQDFRLTDTLNRLRQGFNEQGRVGAVRALVSSPHHAPGVMRELDLIASQPKQFKLSESDIANIQRIKQVLGNPQSVAECLKRDWSHDKPSPQRQGR